MKLDPPKLSQRESYTLFTGIVVPRPIAWVSTVGQDGVFNLAPFSAFTILCMKPAVVAINLAYRRDGAKKDTLLNAASSKEFVVNVVDESLAEVMNRTSAEYPIDVDEFKECGLTPLPSELVKAPRVAESPINMECQLLQILPFGEPPTGSNVIIGEVVRVHIKDECYANGEIQRDKFRAIARLGGHFYCRTTDVFDMKRPFPV